MSRGLFIGRFEPLHKGHLCAIAKAAEKVDELVILIGSSQEELTYANCFTLKERKAMVVESCKQAKIKNITLVWAPDTHNNTTWKNNALLLAGKISIVFSGNPLVRSIFSQEGYEVVDCEKDSPYNIHGTQIRKKIVEDDVSWRDDVPLAVEKIIQKKGVIERIKKLEKMSAISHSCPKDFKTHRGS